MFIAPRGGFHYDGRWEPPELGDDPAEALVEANRRRGVEPDYWTAGARWEWGAKIPEEVYYRGVEALVEAAECSSISPPAPRTSP